MASVGQDCEPHLVWREQVWDRLKKTDTLLGIPSCPSSGCSQELTLHPQSRGGGGGATCRGGFSGVLSSLAGWCSPEGCKQSLPSFTPSTQLPLAWESRDKHFTCSQPGPAWGHLRLALVLSQTPNKSLLPCRRWCIKPPPRASLRVSSQGTTPLCLPMALQVKRKLGHRQGLQHPYCLP